MKETTVQRIKDRYLSHLKTQYDSDSGPSNPTDLQVLPYKKRGRPLLIGEELDEQVRHCDILEGKRLYC